MTRTETKVAKAILGIVNELTKDKEPVGDGKSGIKKLLGL
jgi:hypothetical protein